jgi:acyl transferase domain-containing protein
MSPSPRRTRSRRAGRCRPFDADADGIALAEGIGVTIIKRLADAQRDGDRIYAVIRGIGSSSDGRAKGVDGPAGRRGSSAPCNAPTSKPASAPQRVGLVEAHGTGTVVGDQTEAQSLRQMWRQSGAREQSTAPGGRSSR